MFTHPLALYDQGGGGNGRTDSEEGFVKVCGGDGCQKLVVKHWWSKKLLAPEFDSDQTKKIDIL